MFTDRKNALVRRRTFRAIRKHSWALIRQIFYAAVIACVWYGVIWRTETHIEREDVDLYLVGIFAFLSLTWIMMMTEVLRYVLHQHEEIVRAAKYGDREVIIDLKDDHIPLILPGALAILALIIEGLAMSMPFKNAVDGCGAIFILTLVFCICGRLIYELEDPTEGGWVRAIILRHEEELLTVDSDEEFDGRWKKRRERTKQI